jgi:hypothetical protein
MHKKIEAELVRLAQSILEMKNNNNVVVLHKKSQEIYEKLSLLKFVEQYINETPNTEETANEIVSELDENLKEEVIEVVEEVLKNELPTETKVEETTTSVSEELAEVFQVKEELIEENEIEEPTQQFTLEDELKDAISADVATQLFEKATKENPVIETNAEPKQRSLNDTIFNNNLQVGLNDRIAFVKYLFEGNQEDFNRVLSQLNSFKTEKEAKNFINKLVKPDYDWTDKETYEERLIDLIERKFL